MIRTPMNQPVQLKATGGFVAVAQLSPFWQTGLPFPDSRHMYKIMWYDIISRDTQNDAILESYLTCIFQGSMFDINVNFQCNQSKSCFLKVLCLWFFGTWERESKCYVLHLRSFTSRPWTRIVRRRFVSFWCPVTFFEGVLNMSYVNLDNRNEYIELNYWTIILFWLLVLTSSVFLTLSYLQHFLLLSFKDLSLFGLTGIEPPC